MSRPARMDKAHEFRENRNDYSMCLCGIPADYHDTWEQRQTVIEAVQCAVVSTLNTVGSNIVGSHFTPTTASPIPDDEVAQILHQAQVSQRRSSEQRS